jgi:hypothetical protein
MLQCMHALSFRTLYQLTQQYFFLSGTISVKYWHVSERINAQLVFIEGLIQSLKKEELNARKF